ncbi:MAG: hypothetical protein ACP5SJ_03415 [Candidatus Micrarchaeia archaeon]
MEMLENLLPCLGRSSNLEYCTLSSLHPSFPFSRSLRKAFGVYKYSGDTSRIEEAGKSYDSELLQESMHVIAESLRTGSSAFEALSEIKSRFDEEKRSTPSIGRLQGMDSVTAIGIQIFFPIFAGISANIIGIISYGAYSFVVLSKFFALAVGFYIAHSAASFSRHSAGKGKSTMQVFASSLLSVMVALLAFRSSMLLGKIMLRW